MVLPHVAREERAVGLFGAPLREMLREFPLGFLGLGVENEARGVHVEAVHDEGLDSGHAREARGEVVARLPRHRKEARGLVKDHGVGRFAHEDRVGHGDDGRLFAPFGEGRREAVPDGKGHRFGGDGLIVPANVSDGRSADPKFQRRHRAHAHVTRGREHANEGILRGAQKGAPQEGAVRKTLLRLGNAGEIGLGERGERHFAFRTGEGRAGGAARIDVVSVREEVKEFVKRLRFLPKPGHEPPGAVRFVARHEESEAPRGTDGRSVGKGPHEKRPREPHERRIGRAPVEALGRGGRGAEAFEVELYDGCEHEILVVRCKNQRPGAEKGSFPLG